MLVYVYLFLVQFAVAIAPCEIPFFFCFRQHLQNFEKRLKEAGHDATALSDLQRELAALETKHGKFVGKQVFKLITLCTAVICFIERRALAQSVTDVS